MRHIVRRSLLVLLIAAAALVGGWPPSGEGHIAAWPDVTAEGSGGGGNSG